MTVPVTVPGFGCFGIANKMTPPTIPHLNPTLVTMVNYSLPPPRIAILRKFISWTLIATLIGQPVTASASLAGSLSSTPRSASGEPIQGSLTQLADEAPSVEASRNATFTAEQDINLAGANLSAGNQLALVAGNDLNINASARR